MSVFKDFRKGDLRISGESLFITTREMPQHHIPLEGLSFGEHMGALFSAQELDSFYGSDFYSKIARGGVTSAEETQEPITPYAKDARIALGVIRNPQAWADDISYLPEYHALVPRDSQRNLIDITASLWAADGDVIPQEVINFSRTIIDYSVFLPVLDLLPPDLSSVEKVLSLFHELVLFPLGEKNKRSDWARFADKWVPTTIDIIMCEKIYKDLTSMGLSGVDCLAWTAAATFTEFRKRDYGYNEMLFAAQHNQSPHDYVRMSTRQLQNFSGLFHAWTQDIDDDMWEALINGEQEQDSIRREAERAARAS